MSDTTPPLPPNALGYARNIGGLNNQKLALLGLFLKAITEGPRRIVLPDLVQFDMATFHHRPVPLAEGFDLAPLHDFAARHDVEILDHPPAGDPNGWDFLHYGQNHLALAAATGAIGPGSLIADFFRALVPPIRRSPALARLQDKVFDMRGIRLVAQLRIEKDWPYHVTHRLYPSLGNSEDNAPSCADMIAKIRHSLPDAGEAIYVVADEGQLPAPKDELREAVRAAHGVELIWKSDLLDPAELDDLSILDRSMLDFEMAVTAELFVGTSRSTFSNLAALERHARTGLAVDTHYLYNRPGAALARRTDQGAFAAAALATATDPWDPAMGFHLGEVFQAVGDKHRALEQFSARAARHHPPENDQPQTDDDREETYLTLLRTAQLKADLGVSAVEVIDTYRRAGDIMSERAEAWHAGARHARFHCLYQAGYDLAARGINLPRPAQGRHVDPAVYDWSLLDEYAVCASWTGRHLECLRVNQRLIAEGNAPTEHHKRFAFNIAFSNDRIADEAVDLLPELKSLRDLGSRISLGQDHVKYLIYMRDALDIQPKVIYDIGACVLHWQRGAKTVWPNARFILFEAMDEVEPIFIENGMKDYSLGVLSDIDDKEVAFYQNTAVPGGNSYYKENVDVNPYADTYFNESHKRIKITSTLDTVVQRKGFPKPDLIKMDVQGAEMDVLKGAKHVLEHCSNLILELQRVEYNKGAPLKDEVIAYLTSIGFQLLNNGPFCDNGPDGDYHFERSPSFDKDYGRTHPNSGARQCLPLAKSFRQSETNIGRWSNFPPAPRSTAKPTP